MRFFAIYIYNCFTPPIPCPIVISSDGDVKKKNLFSVCSVSQYDEKKKSSKEERTYKMRTNNGLFSFFLSSFGIVVSSSNTVEITFL
jgi:hypothetical protein